MFEIEIEELESKIAPTIPVAILQQDQSDAGFLE